MSFTPACKNPVFFTRQNTSVLELSDVEAEAWFSGQLDLRSDAGSSRGQHADGPLGSRSRSRSPVRPRESGLLHLLLGDSIARRSGLMAADAGDEVLCRARGGATWSIVLDWLRRDVDAWKLAASESDRMLGHVALWLSGNDVYSGPPGHFSALPTTDPSRLAVIVGVAREVIRQLQDQVDNVQIYLLGPLPRPSCDMLGNTWESTAAYHLERSLLKSHLGDGVILIKLGRALTKKITHKRSGLCKGCLQWFRGDEVHLSPAGYQKLAPKMPGWLRVPE